MARHVVGLSALGAAVLLALPSAAQAWHEHWFFDSYGYYEGDAFPYDSHPPVVRGRPGVTFDYQVAPGEWVRVHPRAFFPQYVPPPRRTVEPRRRWRAHPQPEVADPRVLPREKPQVVTALPSAPEPEEKADPQVTGSIARAPAEAHEPEAKVAARGPEDAGKSGKPMSCEAAADIVSGFGFSDVKPTGCSGNSYAFDATRDGAVYSVQISAIDGELTEVKKR